MEVMMDVAFRTIDRLMVCGLALLALLVACSQQAHGFAPTFNREADCATLRAPLDAKLTPRQKRVQSRIAYWYRRHCNAPGDMASN